MMWSKVKPSWTGPWSKWTIATMLRPLAFIGAILGVFPYTRMTPAPIPPKSIVTVSSPLFVTEAWKEGKKKMKGADVDPPRPPYQLKWCTLHIIIAAIWVSLLVLGYVALGASLLTTVFKQMVNTTRFMHWFIEGNINFPYPFWWWVLLCRRSRLETHLALLEEHHRANPTKGTCTFFALVLGLACTFFNVAINVETARHISGVPDMPSFALFVVMIVHGTAMGNIMLSIVWVLYAHHIEKLEAANIRMTKALQDSDLKALQASREVLMEVRKLCLETEDTFSNAMFPQVMGLVMCFCHGLASMSLFKLTRFLGLSMYMVCAFTACSIFQTLVTFLLGEKCSKKAEETLQLLQGYGEGTDRFSREVKAIRRDLDIYSVVFTLGEFVQLTLFGLWPLLQYLLTQVVLVVQFTQYELGKYNSTILEPDFYEPTNATIPLEN